MAINIEDSVSRWAQNTASDAARQKYIKKTANPRRNPMEAAAAADDRFLASVRASVESGKRKNALLNTPLDKYKKGCAGKGAERLASGAREGVEKMRRAAQYWYPVMDQVSEEVGRMEKGGRANAKARSAKAIDLIMDAKERATV